ncbi:MAG: hypothetical protein KDC56_08965 [Flavobacteriaceae bacterium]|nr:hypothetical protein [Flavobacteriaceae bacterium]
MSHLKKTILPILLASIWISISEFVRNEILLKVFWVAHYQNMGLAFPSEPVNGAVWGIWSLLFAVAIFIMAKKFNFLQTSLLAWFTGFVLMWVVVGNMGVLPFNILYFAIPLSLLEVFVATFIITKLSGKKEN